MANIRLDVIAGTGWNSLQDNIRRTTALSEGLFSSLRQIGSSFQSILYDLMKITGLGTLSLAGIASLSPRLTGYLAEIQASMFKIRDEIAKGLEPAFNTLTELMKGLADWVEKHPELWRAFGSVLQVVLEGVSVLAEALGGLYDSLIQVAKNWNIVVDTDMGLKLDDRLQYIWDTFGPSIVVGLLTLYLTKNPGAALGVGVGSYGIERLSNIQSGKGVKGFDILGGISGLIGGAGVGATLAPAILGTGTLATGGSALIGALVLGAVGYGIGSIGQWLINDVLGGKNEEIKQPQNQNIIIDLNINDNNTRISSYSISTGGGSR